MKQKFVSRLASLFLAVAIIVTSVPMTAWAEDSVDAETVSTVGESEDNSEEISLLSNEEDDDDEITTFSTKTSTLAPGITQSINSGYAADGKLINYYVSVADINRTDVGVHATYKDAQCTTSGMAKMTEQVVSMEELHSDPEDTENYIPYYAIVSGVNGDGYDTGNGMPSGAHVMNGVSGFGISKAGNSSWFAIFEDGKALCGANNTDWDEAVAAHGAVVEAIGGFQLVRKNGVDVPYKDSDYLNDGRYPRSFVGVTADNKVVFMVSDGNNSGGSVGTNWKESVEIMDEAGCTYILCLDGGGSATYVSRPAGSNTVQVTNSPSDGSERAVSNGLVMYTTTPPSDTFEKAEVTAENDYVTPNSKVKISAIGISPAGTAAKIPENAVWSATNGTVTDGVFISDGTLGTAKVELSVDGSVVGSTIINVVLPDSIAFSRDTITVPYGATVELEVSAKYGVNDVALKVEDLIFTASDAAAGTISGNKFTASETGTGTTVTVSVNGASTVSDTIEIKFGKGSETLFDFEEGNIGADINNWRVSHHGGYAVSDIAIVTEETGKVHSGKQALAFHYPMDEAMHGTEFWSGNSLVWTGDSVEIQNASKIGFWIYVPEDATQFSIYTSVSLHDEEGNFAGKTGSSIEIYDEDYINDREHSEWMYFEIPIDADSVYLEDNADKIGQYFNGSQFKLKANCFIEFYAVNIDAWKNNETNYAGDFTFYIDDVTIDYSDAVDDREEPIFSDVTYAVEGMSDASSLNGNTVTKKVVDFAALVSDDMTNANNASGLDTSSAVAYIDGVEVDCEYSDGKITVSNATLTDGVHTIRMGIADKMGNYAETKRQINVKSADNDATVRVRPQDSTLNYILNDAVYWIDIEADEIENVKTVELKLDLDSMNNWVLDQMDVLYGFDCVYSFATAAEKAENILTLKFTRNDKYLSETGTAVLASLPIRVWNYVASDDHRHANAVEAWNCKYGCAPALSIDVDTEMGLVTYSDNTSHTFSSADIHTASVSYTYGLRMKNYDTTYFNAHSYHLHNAVAIDDKAATCTENGYTGRTYCETCASVVEWGTTKKATGHEFVLTDNVLKCGCGQTFTGTWTDGKEYTDGVVVADGWVGNSYYQNGAKLLGVQPVEGYYYNFGDNGICEGKVKFTGLFYDKSVSAYRYSKLGELYSGWVQIGDAWHCFLASTKTARTTDYVNAEGAVFKFDETGKTEGAWAVTSNGTRYYYGPGYHKARNAGYKTFIEINGKTYNFDADGYITTGTQALRPAAFVKYKEVYSFDESGVLVKQITTPGIITCADGYYYIGEDGFAPTDAGVIKYKGDYYFVLSSGKLKQSANHTITAAKANGLVKAGLYYFGDDCKMVIPETPEEAFTGIKLEDGVYHYYIEGVMQKNTGLIKYNDDYYFVCYSGKLKQSNCQTITESNANGLVEPGIYFFGEDCKMVIPETPEEAFTGIKLEDGVYHYYIEGVMQKNTGLIKYNDDYYFVCYSGKLKQNNYQTITESNANGLVEAGLYYFGDDCKMVIPETPEEAFTGIKLEDGVYHYYIEGVMQRNTGLIKYNDDYYFVCYSGKLKQGNRQTITESNANGLVEPGIYVFGDDCKMVR